MNLCGACGEDFGSVSAFDRHRVGSHEMDASAEHPQGRRCLSTVELTERGFRRGRRGRWSRSRFLASAANAEKLECAAAVGGWDRAGTMTVGALRRSQRLTVVPHLDRRVAQQRSTVSG